MRTDGLREYQHRFFGHIGIQEVPIGHAIEIDTPDDLEAARALAQNYESDRREPVDIVAVVTDFDGVHTDDRAIVLEDGTEGVIVSRSDGAGIARLKAAGIRLMILSVEVNAVVAARAKKLGVEVAHGVGDKAVVLRKWLAEQGLDSRHVAYVGNDLRDLDCMGLVGWPIAVADARPEVRAAARWVLQRPGGFGAIREVADRILESNSDVRRMV